MNETVSKLDCAKRQLVTAIWLFFESRDFVSVYSLSSNSLEILTMLCQRAGAGSFLEIAALQTGLTSKKILQAQVNPSRNFFKHADRDADALLEVSDDEAESVIFTASHDLLQLTGKSPVEAQVFITWYGAVHPQKVAKSSELKQAADLFFPAFVEETRAVQKLRGLEFLRCAYTNSQLLNHPETDLSEYERWRSRT